MPELPEVEVTRLGLHPEVIGQCVTGFTVRQAILRWPVPCDIAPYLQGTQISATRRRGKYLLLELSRDAAIQGWLIFHLGMSGTLRIVQTDEPASVHDHVDLHLGVISVRLRDPRRFGAVLWHPFADGPIDQHRLFAKLGVEPLSAEFAGEQGAQHLYLGSRGRTVAIKQILLAGHVVVGVGNIYASESLFHARIHPLAQAGRIGLQRYRRLAQAIRETLLMAINRGGSSLRDFVASDGASGYFQLDCMVYGREHQPCRVCDAVIKQVRIGSRSSFFCPRCQHV